VSYLTVASVGTVLAGVGLYTPAALSARLLLVVLWDIVTSNITVAQLVLGFDVAAAPSLVLTRGDVIR
jgi:multisubunit Na+/H+ antiporter MnhE subunit